MLTHISACVLERKTFQRKQSLPGQAVGAENEAWKVEMKDRGRGRCKEEELG